MTLTHNFFLAAYKQANGRATITAAELHATADSLYIVWRNWKLGQWATAVFEKHGLKLLDYQGKLLDMVEAVDEDYYSMVMSSDMWGDDEDIARCLSWSIAVLRWHHAIRAGRAAESLPASVADAAVWLESYRAVPVGKSGQMSLFLGG